jgi:molybdopterin-guanine dinucleotide biosynthesis protein B
MIPVIGFVGYSNSGKTTLASSVVRTLQLKGRKVGVIKHDAHGHYKEAEETDSGKYMEAGADAVVVVSPDSFARLERKKFSRLCEVVATFEGYDVVIVEGFKTEAHPKIAVFRSAEQAAILSDLAGIIAYATNLPARFDTNVPVFDLNDPLPVAAFIEKLMLDQHE